MDETTEYFAEELKKILGDSLVVEHYQTIEHMIAQATEDENYPQALLGLLTLISFAFLNVGDGDFPLAKEMVQEMYIPFIHKMNRFANTLAENNEIDVALGIIKIIAGNDDDIPE